MAGAIISSTSCEWNTPQWLVDAVVEVLGDKTGNIGLDPCSNEHSLVPATTKIGLPNDGLAYPDWVKHDTIYVNPPYGRTKGGTSIYDWVDRCASAGRFVSVIMVIPAAVDTKHWHELIFPCATRVCFLKGRVNFTLPGVKKVGSTTPTAVVMFGGDMIQQTQFDYTFDRYGYVIDKRPQPGYAVQL